jgi:hypothetical protein
MDRAQDFAGRLRWWRVHCVTFVALILMFVGYGIVRTVAWAIPAGLAITLHAYAGLKADRTLLPNHDRRDESDNVVAWPDGASLEAHESVTLQVGLFVGAGVAAYGVYAVATSIV